MESWRIVPEKTVNQPYTPLIGPMHPQRLALLFTALFLGASSIAFAQVDYDGDYPWNDAVDGGPDGNVPGWYINLGITGLRTQLIPEAPKTILVRYVFANSPAAGLIQVGDRLIGVGGTDFREAHEVGYGPEVFGARGPVGEFSDALEVAQGPDGDGTLLVTLERTGIRMDVTLTIGQEYGAFSATYPENCPKSAKIVEELIPFLLESQGEEGSWGEPIADTFVPLTLLALGGSNNLAAVERNVRYHARETSASNNYFLANWFYTSAAIVLSEYYLATKAEWVIPELQEIYEFLLSGQYIFLYQVAPNNEDQPRDENAGKGGWGHNTGFEGYGPHGQLTAQGALAFGLMRRCGLEVNTLRHKAAYDWIARGTGPNGYLWYSDEVADPESWADMGRTGAAAIASWLSTYIDDRHKEDALAKARLIGRHPQSFPDTHASPQMGMAYTALGAFIDPPSFRSMMDANRWWFISAHTHDGQIYYQPNRDNSDYGSDSRLRTSAVTAFIFTMHQKNLHVTGKLPHDYDDWAATFTGADLIDPTDDLDGDTVSNYEEWLWNLNPTNTAANSASSGPVIQVNPENLSFMYSRREAARSGKIFEIWVSEDLETWTLDPQATQTQVSSDSSGSEQIEVSLDEIFREKRRLFGRVQSR